MKISKGFSDDERPRVATLYWQAFGGKLGRILRPKARAVRFIASALSPAHAFCARDPNGKIIGVAGFKTPSGSLVNGTARDFRQHYGPLGGRIRAAILTLIERDTDNERFLVDGIFVAPESRNQGVGTALLNAVAAEARTRGYRQIRLDVSDNNDGARALYERQGFRVAGHDKIGLLRHVFGFSGATTMVRAVNPAPDHATDRP